MNRYYIYTHTKDEIRGSHHFILLGKEYQPDNGFDSEENAEKHLEELIRNSTGHYFDNPVYKYVIMSTKTPIIY
jgi:hypothetical protein